MNPSEESTFAIDIQKIQALDIVPSILELICRTTGMGFSAVARVTESQWIACAVKDEIGFGLKPGGELQLETTICDEIRGQGLPVVIDDVNSDEVYCNHHTPKMYGFRSYISIPIILKDGSFFGTLCAIDPRPHSLKAANMVTMFSLYADLISYHLQTQDQMKDKSMLLKITEDKLRDSLDDNRQYAHISNHTLQEPLRKLRIYTDLLVHDTALVKEDRIKETASKINNLAADFSLMIKELTSFSEELGSKKDFQLVNLNNTLASAINRLQVKIKEKRAIVDFDVLHTIYGIPQQLAQLFFYILDNALTYSHSTIPPLIKVYSRELDQSELTEYRSVASYQKYCSVNFEDNGIGINEDYMGKIFDLFARLNPKEQFPGLGMGLSQSKRIIRNHEGAIIVRSELEKGTTFSLVFPLSRPRIGLE